MSTMKRYHDTIKKFREINYLLIHSVEKYVKTLGWSKFEVFVFKSSLGLIFDSLNFCEAKNAKIGIYFVKFSLHKASVWNGILVFL